jgi:hypothetical protein
MIFVGDGWAEAHHDLHVADEGGKRLAVRRLPSSGGRSQLRFSRWVR